MVAETTAPRVWDTRGDGVGQCSKSSYIIPQRYPLHKHDEANRFLADLFGTVPSAAPWFHAWTCPPKGADGPRRTFWCQSPDDADPAIVDGATGRNVYIGIALAERIGTARERICQAPDPARPGRIVAAGIVALVCELDIVGPGHDATGARYFPDLDTALRFTTDLPLPPTYLIHSGHGVHLWFAFATPWVFATDDERLGARALSRDWSTLIQRRAAAIGYQVDAVHDLARLMRLPGTVNVNNGDPQPVRILESHSDRRYTPGDFVRCCVAEGIVADPDPNPAPTKHSRAAGDPDPAADADPMADVDADALRVRLENELRRDSVLRAIWERTRPLPRDNDTPSGYDLAVCTRLALRGWTRPELGWLLRYSRRAHNDTNPLRPSGERCTVNKALASAARLRSDRVAVPVGLLGGTVRPGALRLWAAIAAEGGELAGRETIAERLGVNVWTVDRRCAELVRCPETVLTARTDGAGRPGRHSVYTTVTSGDTVDIPRAALDDGLSDSSFAVLAALAYLVGHRPSGAIYHADLSRTAGVSVATLKVALRELRSAGYVDIMHGGWHRPDIYTVNLAYSGCQTGSSSGRRG